MEDRKPDLVIRKAAEYGAAPPHSSEQASSPGSPSCDDQSQLQRPEAAVPLHRSWDRGGSTVGDVFGPFAL